MSLADKPIYPCLKHDPGLSGRIYRLEGGMTLLEHYAGINWTQKEIETVVRTSVEYNSETHYSIVAARARIQLARTLIAELEKVQK